MNGGFSSAGTERCSVLKAHGLQIDLQLYAAHFGSRTLSLTAREFDLLVLLVSEPARVVSRDEIHSRIWSSAGTGIRVVDTYISRLRNKLRGAGHPGIGVVQMRGYRLLQPDGV